MIFYCLPSLSSDLESLTAAILFRFPILARSMQINAFLTDFLTSTVITNAEDMEKFENKRGVFKQISDTILDDYYAEDSEIEDDEDVHSEEDAEMNNNMQKEGKAKQKAKQAKIAAVEKAAQEEILKKKMETFINRTVDYTLRNKDDFNLPAMSSSSMMKLLLSNEEDISHKGKSVQLPSHKNGLQIKKDVLGAKETDVAGSSIAKSDTSPERANVRQLLTKSFIDGFEKCNKSTPLTTPHSQKTWNELPNEGNNTFIQSPNKLNNLPCKNDSIIEYTLCPLFGNNKIANGTRGQGDNDRARRCSNCGSH
ncbi:uncharacterized protein [Temnothorax nylanderi]|uniref:uncharacterized protein n=1 Tax=Temnothorax nylanderi TaxID=102681 RepID=UPI003A835EB2